MGEERICCLVRPSSRLRLTLLLCSSPFPSWCGCSGSGFLCAQVFETDLLPLFIIVVLWFYSGIEVFSSGKKLPSQGG